jgi:transcriptional regulator with XRE-family HTH domain
VSLKPKKNAQNSNNIVGERLKMLRKSRGLTQEGLAEEIAAMPYSRRARCSAVQIGYLENGTRKLSLEYCGLFADFFGVRREYLLGTSDVATYAEIAAAPVIAEGDRLLHLQNVLDAVLGFYDFRRRLNDNVIDPNDPEAVAALVHDKIPNAYIIEKMDGEPLGFFSRNEMLHLAEDIDDFLALKLQRIIEREAEKHG